MTHSEAQDLAPSYCGRNLGMVQVLDWVQGLVQERVLALARAQGGASRQGLWAWTSTFLSLPVGRVILRWGTRNKKRHWALRAYRGGAAGGPERVSPPDS